MYTTMYEDFVLEHEAAHEKRTKDTADNFLSIGES
jgi:hypothetical protein